MYQTLRSGRVLSYDEVERRYEEHQNKWPEAVWLEDALFKYIDPLVAPDPGKDPTAAYLPMLQGSKKGQRKWWLSNRFKYMDSKWNAGDAISQRIQLRGYSKSNITVTPYSDIYPTVQYGSYYVYERGKQGVPTLLPCPIDTLNDTEIYILSAPQIASVGDLSGLNVGFAEFSPATKLQSIKLGDSSVDYENTRLETLSLGSNKLLSILDLRNCVAFGTGSQKSLDLTGCPNIEQIYLDGTKLTGITLPNGGVVSTLHLPDTISNLTIRNQPVITDFKVSYVEDFVGDGATTEFELKEQPLSITYIRRYFTDSFVGDGATKEFTLQVEPTRINNVYLSTNLETGYTISGNIITFNTAPGSGVPIRIEYFLTEDDGYSLSGKTIRFTTAPENGASIRVASIETALTDITRLRIENCSSVIDSKKMMMRLDNKTPIRLLGVNWTSSGDTETRAILDKIQNMTGIDSTDAGLIIPKAVVSGVLSMDSIGTFDYSETFTGTGGVLSFNLRYVPDSITSVTVDGVETTEYVIKSNTLTFVQAPASGAVIAVTYVASLYDSITTFYPDLYLRIGGSIKFKVRYYSWDRTNHPDPLQCGVDEHGNPVYELIIEEGHDAPDPTKVTYNESFDGDGTTTTFTLQELPTSVTGVDVSGIPMVEDTDYTISGKQIVFTTAPAESAYILVRYAVGYIDVPAMPSDAQYTYVYTGWDNNNNESMKNIHSNMDFIQTFEWVTNSYIVTFVNDDGSYLYETTVLYGREAIYAGTQNPPRKTNVDNPDEWIFTGWSDSISEIKGPTTVRATYVSPIQDTEIEEDWEQILVNANNRYVEHYTGNGTTTRFTLQFSPTEIMYVKVGGGTVIGYEVDRNAIVFPNPVDQDAEIEIKYRTKVSYPVGSYKDLTLNDGTTLRMQIVGVNTDELADGSDTAQYSWISKNLYPTGHTFNQKYIEGVGQYVYDSETGIWSSAINGKPLYNAIGEWNVTVTGSGVLNLRYMISSETTHDYADIYVDDVNIASKISGETTWMNREIPVTNGQVVKINATYHKDVNQDGGMDTLYLRFEPGDGVAIQTQFQGTDSIPSRGAIGGFDGMDIYPYLQTEFKALLPEQVRINVKAVKKYTKSLLSDGTNITLEHDTVSRPTIWIPSLREVGFLMSTYETKGPTYNAVYYDANTRKKKVDGSDNYSYYWLRSQYTDESIACITALGSDGGLGTDNPTLFPLGFST